MKQSPFKFLDAYQKEDIDVFFGREKETEALYSALSGVKHLLVYGPSGAGKTSLIECGLRNQFSEADWFALTIRRGANISASVFKTINEALEQKIQLDPKTQLPTDPEVGFGEAVEILFEEYYQPIYLLFDQFEELLISGSVAEQQYFFKQLDDLIRHRIPCRVMLIMREEFIGHLSEFEPLCPTIFQYRFRLEKMRTDNVRSVIQSILTSPKYSGSFTVQDTKSLVSAILSKLPDKVREIELTHVQVFLSELWDRANKKTDGVPVLEKSLVRNDDNLERILDGFLKKQLAELEQKHGEKLPLEVLAAMISERHTKLQMTQKELLEDLKLKNVTLPNDIAPLLKELTLRRILRQIRTNDETQYEIAHDVLALVIGKNLTEEMQLREKAREVYKVYEARAGLLERNDITYLQAFEAYLPYPKALAENIKKSEKQLTKRRKRLFTAGIALILTLSGLTLWAFRERREANENRDRIQQALDDLREEQLAKERVEAEKQLIEFDNLNRRANTIIEVAGCPADILETMTDIAVTHPDSSNLKVIIEDLKIKSVNCVVETAE